MIRTLVLFLAVAIGCVGGACRCALAESTARYGLDSRPMTRVCLVMPEDESAPKPLRLSQTWAFENVHELQPAGGLIPYDLNFSFWSDGALKWRWAIVPNRGPAAAGIEFSTNGEWRFPAGTVFVKHFELVTDETRPDSRRRLETRFIVCDKRGGVYGATYKWRADNSDADLLQTNLSEIIPIKTTTGWRTQTWYYPSPQDCQTCHTERAGGVLGVKTRQLNREFRYPNGATDNQLRVWNHLGLFSPTIDEAAIPTLPKLARSDDPTRSIEDKARSYLDANCAHCHRPGGTVAFFDARYQMPLPQQELINGRVLFDQGIDRARVIAPNDTWRSLALLRVESLEGDKMPPLAHNVLDRQGADLLREWIGSLKGNPVLSPPTFSPSGGKYAQPVEVGLSHPESGVTIRYTLDGAVPTANDPVYQGPIKLSAPATIRAKAFKAGFTRSVTAQQTFEIGD